ncbi:MAG TPA: hypothetical protein VGQ37_20330 [Vicinamibacterales bacterium]|jgi:hypothetical protein|nr:hypothetical protein [Vicinamibacterales bacterium]
MRFVAPLICALALSACSVRSPFRPLPEYEEEIYLALDGTATVNVNASIASLVALRGADLPTDPRARVDRAAVRRFFQGPGARVTSVSLARRHTRRFAHVAIDVDDVRKLSQLAPFAWSRYRLDARGDAVDFQQLVGKSTGRAVSNVGWNGSEIVAFRMHIPSEILFHNTTGTQRGNILEWDQPLAARLDGEPLDLQVNMEPRSILYSTLLLFGGTVLAAAATFAIVIWLIARKGRTADESARV